MNVAELRELWPMPGGWTLHPSPAGTNNRSVVIQTPAGTFYLRVYQNQGDAARVRYEHTLLARLQACRLSFAVPAPVPTRTGATFAHLTSAGGALAALCPLIPGRPPQRQHPAEVRLCGAALGELDVALGTLPLALAVGAPSAFVDLAQVHPLLPDPQALPPALPLAHALRARVQALLARVADEAPELCAALPPQLIHGDFAASNVLLERERVRGVLDFEFSGPNPRALDLAIGLAQFMAYGGDTGRAMDLGAAFSGGRGIPDAPVSHVQSDPSRRPVPTGGRHACGGAGARGVPCAPGHVA